MQQELYLHSHSFQIWPVPPDQFFKTPILILNPHGASQALILQR